jgi:hypothetical protein
MKARSSYQIGCRLSRTSCLSPNAGAPPSTSRRLGSQPPVGACLRARPAHLHALPTCTPWPPARPPPPYGRAYVHALPTCMPPSRLLRIRRQHLRPQQQPAAAARIHRLHILHHPEPSPTRHLLFNSSILAPFPSHPPRRFPSISTSSTPFPIPTPEFSMSSPNSRPKIKISPANLPPFCFNSTPDDPISTPFNHSTAIRVSAPILNFLQPCQQLELLCYNRSCRRPSARGRWPDRPRPWRMTRSATTAADRQSSPPLPDRRGSACGGSGHSLSTASGHSARCRQRRTGHRS